MAILFTNPVIFPNSSLAFTLSLSLSAIHPVVGLGPRRLRRVLLVLRYLRRP